MLAWLRPVAGVVRETTDRCVSGWPALSVSYAPTVHLLIDSPA